MAKMMGKSGGDSYTKRSSNDDKPLGTPSKGMMTRDSEKIASRFPPHRDSGTAALLRGGMNAMENPKVLGDARKYLSNMQTEVKGPTFDQSKSIHGRMAGQKSIDRVEN